MPSTAEIKRWYRLKQMCDNVAIMVAMFADEELVAVDADNNRAQKEVERIETEFEEAVSRGLEAAQQRADDLFISEGEY